MFSNILDISPHSNYSKSCKFMQIIETHTNTSKSLNLCKGCTKACHLTLLVLPWLWSTTKPRRINSTHTNSPISPKYIQTSKLQQIPELLFKYFKMHTNAIKGVKLQESFYNKILLKCTRGVLSYSSCSGITELSPCIVYKF